jgi:hypothetical protein
MTLRLRKGDEKMPSPGWSCRAMEQRGNIVDSEFTAPQGVKI